ncbi:hypothetical protein F3Y22_tig00110694pilonHSYRG00256 [Hibiscus syriacus]|uniref:Ataxin-2 C-terminal domain-containing protein n=1 Tax=Hibiscus syriacus TaxID=106335 RepID=A0A6A2ZUQ7_HIBSY|nr:protein EARLY RESPONSIVE TO DEHYDRATION 15-like [Hibiscus syriacus]KAE8695684.1 hypothetical protein F3Y22_tig00110694pilonHSYRG00256 [Hibiscus syriacus]
MEILSQRSSTFSTLNPNAPMFVPLVYRTVEDFSDQWWALVQSSPSFRDYWLQERFHDPQNGEIYHDDLVFPDDLDAVFDEYYDSFVNPTHEEKEEGGEKGLVSVGAFKWRKGRVVSESPRVREKAPKIVNVRVSPRTIHQPR